MYYGDNVKVTNYTKNFDNLEFIPGNGDQGWDYEIIYSAAAKFNESLIKTWPPKNTVYEVMAGGIPLAAIVKNKYSGLSLKEIAEKFPTDKNYINLSLELYNTGDYINSIIAAKRAFELNNKNTVALNNIGAAANVIGLYEISQKYLEIALDINPEFTLAKNNLRAARQQLSSSNQDRNTLLNNTLLAYKIGEYEFEVIYSLKIIRKYPKDAIAWNNLCSAYNALEQYLKAENACRKALEFSPDFQLAKNNLNYALKMQK